MSLFRYVVILLVFLMGMATLVFAQPAATGISALQAKETLTDDDRNAIRDFVREKVSGVVSGDTSGAEAAFSQLRDGFTGSAAFKEAYALACLDTISSAYKKAEAAAAARLLIMLNLLDDPRTLNVFIEALGDDRTAVRAAAAIGLRNLRPKLAADADAYNRSLNALREAGKKESSVATLELIYDAISYANVQPAPNLRASATALLEVLEDRVKQYETGDVRADGAEVAALTQGAALRKAFDDAETKRYAIVLGKMLFHAARRYTGGANPLGLVEDKTGGPDAIALRNAMEIMIKQSEEQLTQILAVKPAPQVTETMARSKKTQGADLVDIVNETNKWIPIIHEKLGLELSPVNTPPPPTTRPAPKPKPHP